jgi:hypothetical protein
MIVLVITLGEVVTKGMDAFARRSQRPVAPPAADNEQIRELNDKYDLLAGQLERLAEEQRFLTRLLEERPALPGQSERKEAS